MSLPPGDSTFVPIKIFVTKRPASDKDHLIRFLLAGHGNSILTTSETKLRVYIKRNVNMFALVTNILLDPASDSIKIPITVTNPGNTAQKVTLINRYPSIFQDNAFHTTTQFIIKPSADTLITFARLVVRKMLNSEGFDVTFSGLYDNGDIFGMAYIKVQSARNERAYRDESLSDSYNLNSITVSSQSMFSQNQSYIMTGRGNLELPKGMLGYNLDLTTWKNSYSPPMARNTFVTYKNQKLGLMAGNINKNLDINLSGRGGSFMLNDTSSNNTYEAGYRDGNANLLGNRQNTFFPVCNAGWGSSYIYLEKSKKLLALDISAEALGLVWDTFIQKDLFGLRNEKDIPNFCAAKYKIYNSYSYEFVLLNKGIMKELSYYDPEYYDSVCYGMTERIRIINSVAVITHVLNL